MIELAFDTATAACTVALRRADGELFEITPPPERLTERPAHTTELLPAILEVTERAGVKLGDVDRIAVGVGPGASQDCALASQRPAQSPPQTESV